MPAYNYTYALNQLVEGTMLQNASSTRGAMWLNVRGFEPSAVPFIQQNLGVHSLDAYDELRQVAGLAMMAAQYKLYGDLIYLYSLFGMNAAFGASSVEGAAMKEVLWRAATGCASLQCDGRDAVTIPTHLLSLYASTSTCPSLSRVYEEFTASWANATTRLRIMRTLDEEPESSSPTTNSTITPQAASIVTCSGLVTLLKDGRMSPKYGGPRSVCYSSCCIKWTGNGVFHWADILPTIQTFCLNRAVANTRLDPVPTIHCVVAYPGIAI
ncbi:hypothetical protein KEM52_000874 [Ascosphaera acerosa]|nr:hypothetical protein KEM52_000874 [Ascosphaera acerosa]